MERNRLMTKDTNTTEKKYPISIADFAIALLLLSRVIISDSLVVKPALVRREMDWNLAFSLVRPVTLRKRVYIWIKT